MHRRLAVKLAALHELEFLLLRVAARKGGIAQQSTINTRSLQNRKLQTCQIQPAKGSIKKASIPFHTLGADW